MEALTGRFQFKIQRALDIKDDEIEGLSELLVKYRSQIEELKIQSAELDQKLYDKKKGIKQIVKDKKINEECAKTQKISQFHQYVITLQEQQNHEIKELQDEFQSKLSRFHEFSNEQMMDQENAFDEELQKVKNELEMTQKQITEFKGPEENLNSSFLINQNERIHKLQSIVENKSEERKAMLLEFKTQISEMLQIINDDEKIHLKNIEDIQTHNRENTQKYQEIVQDIQTKRHNEIKKLRLQKKEAEDQLKSLTEQLSQMKAEFAKSFTFSAKKFEAMRTLTMVPVQRSENVPQNVLHGKDKQKVIKSLELRKDKEIELNNVRKENYGLHQRVTLMKHSLRYHLSE